MMMPTVFTDAESNWRMTMAAVRHRIPAIRYSHQPVLAATAAPWASASLSAGPSSGARVSAELTSVSPRQR